MTWWSSPGREPRAERRRSREPPSLQPEPSPRRLLHERRGAVDAEPAGVDRQVVVLGGAPRPPPVALDVLLAVPVRLFDDPLRTPPLAWTRAGAGAGDEVLERRDAEHVQRVALGEHHLRAAPHDHRRAARRRVGDY